MPDIQRIRHAVVTPSRNEGKFLPSIIESMSNQTIIPVIWVIVSHNSTDNTIEILREAKSKYDWIEYIDVKDESTRKRGSQIASLVNKGINSIDLEWDFISKIDADMILPENYFEMIFQRFSNNPKLGIASGTCYIVEGGKKIIENVSSDHTRGGLKTYRSGCYNEIGGIREIDGWDGIDNISAQMKNWETMPFREIEALHQRRTGSFSGLISGCFESGKFAHTMNYHPLFMIARSMHRMKSKPIVVGGLSMITGFMWNKISRKSKLDDKEIVLFLRKKQKNRLKFWKRT
tara:strand:+ start:730 stop:1599 length:870 start_codon:yes stop_codon:yes gene_type:complete